MRRRLVVTHRESGHLSPATQRLIALFPGLTEQISGFLQAAQIARSQRHLFRRSLGFQAGAEQKIGQIRLIGKGQRVLLAAIVEAVHLGTVQRHFQTSYPGVGLARHETPKGPGVQDGSGDIRKRRGICPCGDAIATAPARFALSRPAAQVRFRPLQAAIATPCNCLTHGRGERCAARLTVKPW